MRPIIRVALLAGLVATPVLAQYAAPSEEEIAEALKAHSGDSVLARVGETEITLGDAAITYESLPPQVRNAPIEQIGPALVEQLVTEHLLAAAAEKAQLAGTPEVKRRLEAARRGALAESYIAAEIEKRVDDDAVRALYDAEVAAFEAEEQIRARHILVKTEDEAKAIVGELDEGADFAELAKEKSTGPSGPNGGDLSWFTRGMMVPSFEETAFGIEEPGGIGGPVETQFGWHVIKLEERGETEPPAFERMAPQLRAQATEAAVTAILDEVRDGIEIERAEDGAPIWLIARPEAYKN